MSRCRRQTETCLNQAVNKPFPVSLRVTSLSFHSLKYILCTIHAIPYSGVPVLCVNPSTV